jgi:S1-C subfamily serine protease
MGEISLGKAAVLSITIATICSLLTGLLIIKISPTVPSIIINETPEEVVVTSVFDDIIDSVVHIKVTWDAVLGSAPRTGSGMIIDKEGHILTNHHVVEKAKEVEVSLSTGEVVEAEVVGTDLITDIAVLKISPPRKLKPVRIGDSDTIKPGQMAIAIGNPYVLENTITVGIVSAVNRTLTSDGYKIKGVIQTDAAINPGNSGGPLLNSKGEVIGINSAIFTISGGFEGIGFAIPINTAINVAKQLIEKGKVIRPWLGITGTDLTENLIEAFDVPVNEGALIMEVVPDGPADRAGLRGTKSTPFEKDFVLGDIIVGINGQKIENMDKLIEVLFGMKVGQEVEVEYIREGKKFKTKVKLGERPIL